MNKLRWAISTAFGDAQSRYPFQASQYLATVFAQEVLEVVKAAEKEVGIVGSTSTIRGFLEQEEVRSKLDKLA